MRKKNRFNEEKLKKEKHYYRLSMNFLCFLWTHYTSSHTHTYTPIQTHVL